jgi:hypothetical protein
MENSEAPPTPQPCGLDCSCNNKKGIATKTKLILFCIIIVCAGAVLANSIIKRSRQAHVPIKADYASALASNTSQAIKMDSLSERNIEKARGSFIPLPSLSSLDTVAIGYDGVFILLIKNESDKTPTMTKEITDAIGTIGAQGIRMGAFQLAVGTQNFEALNAQLPSPGVVIIMKGRGMRGVAGGDITQTKLLQACVAAMMPSGCGPGACRKRCN